MGWLEVMVDGFLDDRKCFRGVLTGWILRRKWIGILWLGYLLLLQRWEDDRIFSLANLGHRNLKKISCKKGCHFVDENLDR